ncbi:hypothetical protein ACFLS4_05475 [Bacteroidota bacterium]
MKKIIYILTAFLLVSCGDDSTIGKYTKQPLPEDFSYKIIEDASDDNLEKNQLTIEISKKITIEQIATLADKLYSSKPKQRRFYIFYLLSDMDKGSGAWAISHFDPELEIEIIGSTEAQDIETSDTINIDGVIIGKWRSEKSLMGASLVLYKDSEEKLKMKITFKDGGSMDDEIKESTENGKTRYDDGNEHGEYYILESNGNLGMYSPDGKFDEAVKIE